MPSIEVGTVGGGTFLPAQSTCLDILNVKGASYERPGAHADQVQPPFIYYIDFTRICDFVLIMVVAVGQSCLQCSPRWRVVTVVCPCSWSLDEESHGPQPCQGLSTTNEISKERYTRKWQSSTHPYLRFHFSLVVSIAN